MIQRSNPWGNNHGTSSFRLWADLPTHTQATYFLGNSRRSTDRLRMRAHRLLSTLMDDRANHEGCRDPLRCRAPGRIEKRPPYAVSPRSFFDIAPSSAKKEVAL